jgi:hypothetical protein
VTGTKPVGTAKPGAGRSGRGAAEDWVAKWRDELEEQLETEENFFNDSKAEELAFWQAKLALTAAGSKEQMQVEHQIYELRKQPAQQGERDAIEEQDYKARVAQQEFERRKAQIDAEVKLGKLSAREGIEAEQEALDQKWALDQEYFEKSWRRPTRISRPQSVSKKRNTWRTPNTSLQRRRSTTSWPKLSRRRPTSWRSNSHKPLTRSARRLKV